ncbi:hypothetical protein CGK74_13725 [Thauera propionica]|uniref:Holin n=1 Tax=Thauera propionica TaxID=2019431 RepID=A0A235EW67_9RHOO|nr:hypothetical protein [Thauera propionica]OYD53269.1 hypothetical protein CGK74_13725 [Thauera propionica]
MTDPISPPAIGLTAAGITLFGVATGLDPVLLFAGAGGGWWAMTYQPVLGALDRLSRIGISALVGGWGSPLAVGYAAGAGWLPEAVPQQAAGFPVALGIGLLAVDVIGRGVLRLAQRKAEEIAK